IDHDLVRLHALHLRDETDPAGIVLVARIVETLSRLVTTSDARRLHCERLRGACLGSPPRGHDGSHAAVLSAARRRITKPNSFAVRSHQKATRGVSRPSRRPK